MKELEITALAREYAEFTDMSPVDKKNISAICECFLKYTLRRYCLVEKDTVREALYKLTDKFLEDNNHKAFGVASVAIESLFPEIAKEVEG